MHISHTPWNSCIGIKQPQLLAHNTGKSRGIIKWLIQTRSTVCRCLCSPNPPTKKRAQSAVEARAVADRLLRVADTSGERLAEHDGASVPNGKHGLEDAHADSAISNALLNERIMGSVRCRLRRQCRHGSWNGVRVKLLLASMDLGIRTGSAEHRRTWFSLFQSRVAPK